MNEDEIIKKNNNNEFSVQIDNEKKKIQDNFSKLNNFYISDNLNKFVDVFNSISDKNIEKLVRVFNEIKLNNNSENISIDNISYTDLINELEGKKEMNDLLSIFKNDEGYNLLEYLKSRISIFHKSFEPFICSDSIIKSIGFLQKILLNNLIYILDDQRFSYFNTLLTDLQIQKESNYREKTINIDRYKANNFYDKYNENSEKIPDIDLNETIFGQLFHIYENVEGKIFLLEKNERLFRVELLGEGAIDAGGPFHETISGLCNELQSDYIDLFIKTPNNKYNIGELRDKYIINPNSNKIIHKKAYEFIGKLMAMAISSGEALNLNLHPIIWKKILDNEISFEEYKTIDYSFFNSINELEKELKKNYKNSLLDLNFVIKNSNESDIELIKNGKEIEVTQKNLEKYINLSKSMRIDEINTQIEYIKKGLFSAIKKNIIQILTWNQLEEMVCGKINLDIDDFKEHTVYQGYKGDEQIIKWFWEWLINAKEEEKIKYLKFVSGRTRLPKSGIGYEYTHTITQVSINNKFPKSSTCFFTLKLPNYDSQKEFIERMKYSIENCSDITDH